MIAFVGRHYRATLYILIALAVTAGIGALIYFKWYRPTYSGKNASVVSQLKGRRHYRRAGYFLPGDADETKTIH